MKIPQNQKGRIQTKHLLLIIGTVTSIIFSILMYLKAIEVNYELAIGPIWVITVLTYGESILLMLMMSPINIFLKITKLLKYFASFQNIHHLVKQS
jgi:hypothetical protein